MFGNIVESDLPKIQRGRLTAELVIFMGCVVAAASGLVGVGFTILWIANGSPSNAIALLISAITGSIGLGSLRVTVTKNS